VFFFPHPNFPTVVHAIMVSGCLNNFGALPLPRPFLRTTTTKTKLSTDHPGRLRCGCRRERWLRRPDSLSSFCVCWFCKPFPLCQLMFTGVFVKELVVHSRFSSANSYECFQKPRLPFPNLLAAALFCRAMDSKRFPCWAIAAFTPGTSLLQYPL